MNEKSQSNSRVTNILEYFGKIRRPNLWSHFDSRCPRGDVVVDEALTEPGIRRRAQSVGCCRAVSPQTAICWNTTTRQLPFLGGCSYSNGRSSRPRRGLRFWWPRAKCIFRACILNFFLSCENICHVYTHLAIHNITV